MSGRFGKIASVVSENVIIRSINRGLINIIPFVLIGAFIVAILNLPIPSYQDAIAKILGTDWRTVSLMIHFGTLNVIGLIALFSVSFSLSMEEKMVKDGEISPLVIVLTSFASYTIVMARSMEGLTFHYPGANGLFAAIFIAVISVKCFSFFNVIRRKFRISQRSVFDHHLTLRSAFKAIFPVFATLFLFAVFRVFIGEYFSNENFVAFFGNFVNRYLSDDGFFSMVIIILMTEFFWFIGIHGGDVIMDGISSIANGTADGGVVLTKEFFDTFIYLGGSGATLGMLLALFFVKTRHKGRRLAKVSLFPAIFNINETLIYGVPIIFNPLFFIPFVCSPIVLGAIAFVSTHLGILPVVDTAGQWTTPIFLSGYLATGSYNAIFIQAIGLAVSTFIYIPFIKLAGRSEQIKNQNDFVELQKAAISAAENEYISLIARKDHIGELARDFATELREQFTSKRIPFRMVFQPKTDDAGRVKGAEALLRWNHPDYGNVSPVMIVEMCDEAELSIELGRWVLEKSIQGFAAFRRAGVDDISISINLNPQHIHADPGFPDFVAKVLSKYRVPPDLVELEITEHAVVNSGESTKEIFRRLRDIGVSLSIDDLGMGYSSLTYISDFGAKTVKIDTSLIRGIENDVNRQEIVRSILRLQQRIDIEIIVEGVETRAELEVLSQLGTKYYQGYYFSKPLPPREFLAYHAEHGSVKQSSPTV
ncbi:MAG: EAL domain-containing protein [Clostridiales Family XIII bacterium]|jgi:lactose/cellobiose-specific phosphotransferase system IIC component|nr:EAL domain-containing protein [Clostridiales Family XIII bacterium]